VKLQKRSKTAPQQRSVMSNAKRAEVLLDLDRPRNLKLDFNTMCVAEGVLGRGVVTNQFGMSEMRALVWAGLRHEDRTLTLEKAGELIGNSNLPDTMEKVAKCLGEFFNQGESQGDGQTTSTG